MVLVVAQTMGASHFHLEDSDHGSHGGDCLLCIAAEQSNSTAAESGDKTFAVAQQAPIQTRVLSFPANAVFAPYQSRAPPKIAIA